jgi:hypothetical protein
MRRARVALRRQLHKRPNALDIEAPKKSGVPQPYRIEAEVEHLVDRVV